MVSQIIWPETSFHLVPGVWAIERLRRPLRGKAPPFRAWHLNKFPRLRRRSGRLKACDEAAGVSVLAPPQGFGGALVPDSERVEFHGIEERRWLPNKTATSWKLVLHQSELRVTIKLKLPIADRVSV